MDKQTRPWHERRNYLRSDEDFQDDGPWGWLVPVGFVLIVLTMMLAITLQAHAEAVPQPWKENIEGFRSNTRIFEDASSLQECQARLEALAEQDGQARTSGRLHYHCRVVLPVDFVVAPPEPTCDDVPRPLADTRVQQCPAGTVGTYGEMREYVAHPAQVPPDQCWQTGEWVAVQDPAQVCVPIAPEEPEEPEEPGVTWTHCADQYNRCEFSGTRIVRFGADTRWAIEQHTDGVWCCVSGTWNCPATGGVSTNPAPQTPKFCELSSEIPPQPEPEPEPVLGSASLSWQPPTENTDGTALTDLAGFIVVHGTSANDLSHSISIADPAVTRYTVDGLSAGTHYFAVIATNRAGAQSARSNVVSKTLP